MKSAILRRTECGRVCSISANAGAATSPPRSASNEFDGPDVVGVFRRGCAEAEFSES
jgi:hypothetical protein